MKVIYHSLSDKGTTREHNEDAYLNDTMYSLFMVADGMGGYQGGDVASKVTLSCILSYLENATQNKGVFTQRIFREAIAYANRSIYNLRKADASIKAIGTTFVCFIPGETGGFAFNIGDSRLYRFHLGKLTQITRDHSAEQEIPEFMRNLNGGKYSGLLSRALGTNETVEADVFDVECARGDILLLCTDGLYTMISDADIIKVLGSRDPLKDKTRQLVNKANKAGGKDNITVTLIQIESDDHPEKFEMVESV
ncbi:MAG: serine/threonine-protein phosphatase [Candidatus Aureabacteria bacterium]|nr:serine/threonine-protein phosphatase [Candidatus Auribacterota bacterium]